MNSPLNSRSGRQEAKDIVMPNSKEIEEKDPEEQSSPIDSKVKFICCSFKVYLLNSSKQISVFFYKVQETTDSASTRLKDLRKRSYY